VQSAQKFSPKFVQNYLLTNSQNCVIIVSESEGTTMKYRLIDDPLCDLDENIPCCENCEECEYFLDCMEEDEESEVKQ
jgi:hypothetical protein